MLIVYIIYNSKRIQWSQRTIQYTTMLYTDKIAINAMHPLYLAGFRKIGIFSYFLSPSTILKRDVETVSVCSSVRPSVCPSIQRESPLTATIFHQSLPNCYSLFIPMKSFIIFSFIKMWQKLLPWQTFFFSSFNTYLLMSVPYMKSWGQVDAIFSYYLHKGATPLLCNFLKILTKNVAWQHFHCALFFIYPLQ